MDKYAIIMAGGGGTRFWPLSRQSMPKQLLNISGNDAMINETISRNTGLICAEDIYVIASKSQEEVLKKVLARGISHSNILLEPIPRNTAACIGYAASVIKKRHGDGILCVFPSDHVISEQEKYLAVMEEACEIAAKTDKIVTVGIKPTFPSTGYGYIKYEGASEGGAKNVLRFIEKPNSSDARSYIKDGRYLWNSGMFVFRTDIILESFKRFIPKLYRQLEKLSPCIDTGRQEELVQQIYPDMPGLSIDYGILERSDDVVVIPGDFGWNDVGSWDALGAIFPTDEDGNIVKAEHIGIGTRNCIIYGNKLIASIGIENLIIVGTDDAMLICPKQRSQEVRDIVELLKKKGMDSYI